jgi:uncharacterized protein YjbI with pentapeptide repeats
MSMTDPYSCPGCDLTGQSFAGKDLTDANLQNATLDGASFKGALNMTRAKLSGASMKGTDFTGCDLTTAVFDAAPKFGLRANKRTTFDGATIPFTSLGHDWSNLDLTAVKVLNLPADLQRLKATHAVLPGFVFGNRDLTNVHFRFCDLTGADFSGATLDSAVFTEQCTLTRAKFVGAKLANAVFDGSTLTQTDFSKLASLAGASFLQTRMDGTIFDGNDVTSCAFTDPPRFSVTPDLITSFRGATLNLSLIRKQWSFLDLTDATIVGLTKDTDLTYLQARYGVFGAFSFAGMTMLEADFTNALFVGTIFTGAKLTNAKFDEAKARSPQGSPPKASIVFDNATMTNASMHGAQLPGASFVQASLHGATMTSMVLRNADLTGANLGTQAVLFTVSDPTDYQKLLDALQHQNVSVLVTVLNAHGIPVRRITVTPASPVPPVSAWTIKDEDTQTTYTARDLLLNGQKVISLFNNAASHANLGDTYMPGAVLTQANLYGMTAPGIHLYGIGTKLDSAILEAVDFSGANLGTANFRQATLADAIFDDAILTNADFSGAMLLPGQAGRGVSFHRANLQGASFLSANLYGANLQDAALCFPLPTTPVSTYGVWLFRVGQGDARYAAVLKELQSAQLVVLLDPDYEAELTKGGTLSAGFRSAFAKASKNKYQLSANAVAQTAQHEARYHVTDVATRYDIVPGIDTSGTAAWQVVPTATPSKAFYIPLYDVRSFIAGPVSKELRTDFQQRGAVSLGTSATVGTEQSAIAWQINDGDNSFELWDGFDDTDRQLFARLAMPNLTALFSDRGFKLSRETVTADKGGVLEIDNDSGNPFGSMLGYVTFNAVPGKDGIDIYGSTMRIQRLADNNQLQYYDIGCAATKIAPDNFDVNTYFPNGRKEPTVIDGTLDSTWLRAQSPPRPPLCVPNPSSYCPPPLPSSRR